MNAQLTTRLRHLRLSGMVEALPGRVAQAETAPLPHLEFLELLVEDELGRRADRLYARRLKQAGLVTVTSLADFDWSFNPKIPKTKLVELASARFVQTHGGVLLIGPPGVGKSHMATAIAVGAIRAGHRALVRSTFDLAADRQELSTASPIQRRRPVVKRAVDAAGAVDAKRTRPPRLGNRCAIPTSAHRPSLFLGTERTGAALDTTRRAAPHAWRAACPDERAGSSGGATVPRAVQCVTRRSGAGPGGPRRNGFRD